MKGFFEENAWLDTTVAVDWINKTLKPATEHPKRFVLLVDNLTGQVHKGLKEHVSNRSGIAWYGIVLYSMI